MVGKAGRRGYYPNRLRPANLGNAAPKAVSEYYWRKKGSRDGLFNWCRACCIARSTEYKRKLKALRNSHPTPRVRRTAHSGTDGIGGNR
jgi:hypothetical protein